MKKRNKKDFTLVARKLINEVESDIKGENESFLFGSIPSDVVMIGMIDGCNIKRDGADYSLYKKATFMPNIGLRFRISKNDTKFTFRIRGKLFYSVKPTYKDQIKYLIKEINVPNVVDFDSLSSYYQMHKNDEKLLGAKFKLVPSYKSINLNDLGQYDVLLDDFDASLLNINNEITSKLNKLIDDIFEDSFTNKFPERELGAFLNEDIFNQIVKSNCEKDNPSWQLKVDANLFEHEEYNEVIIQLFNETANSNLPKSSQTAIFNGGLLIKTESDFKRIKINSAKHYYTDNPYLPGIGSNCTVKELNSNSLETENMPITEQKRLITIDKFNDFVTFENLISNPVVNLNTIYDKLIKKLNEYQDIYEIERHTKSVNYLKNFQEEITTFKCEINRFKNGITQIETKSNVRKAFELTNRTFGLNSYNGWRLFQIVFLVSEIPDMIYSEYKDTPGFHCDDIDNVDLIYFPTGGGKTETFLGCCIFSAFFDRIRGKEFGVTALIKYPLRLLASQQLDRVLDLAIKANKIKAENNIPGKEFSVGFYTGKKNTFNKISEYDKNKMLGLQQNDLNKLYRQIDVCPKCGNENNVYFDIDTWTLKHKCKHCGFEPPIYIVDDEIYRYGPTFIVSTIDKMAIFGLHQDFKSIFGQNKNYCPKHGCFHGNRCNVRGCKETEYEILECKDPVPTLDIQDEMHLVNESLGTFDSHYESAIYYFCNKLLKDKNERKKIKYIGATATISNYEQQIKNLYNKDSKIFPCSVKKENFYSKLDMDDTCRIIVGAALNGGSITNSIKKLSLIIRKIICSWNINPELILPNLISSGFSGDVDNLKEILQYYLIQIIYTNSKTDGGNLREALANQGNNELSASNLPLMNISEITSNVEFRDIKDIIHTIENVDDKFNGPNMIIATSSISHGVDVSNFNQIYFYGMPNKTSEYIQAYSRVGRTYTGIVFDIFRLIRDRDKSYLKNFYNFHQYKEQLIDPVPINRYAKNAVHITLPGIFSGLLLQRYSSNERAITVTNLIRASDLTLDMITNDILEIYDCNNLESKLYKEIIINEVKKMFLAFENNVDSNIKIGELLEKVSDVNRGPMTNLRDVEIGYEIKKD